MKKYKIQENEDIDRYKYLPYDAPLIERIKKYSIKNEKNKYCEMISLIDGLYSIHSIFNDRLRLSRDGKQEEIDIYCVFYFFKQDYLQKQSFLRELFVPVDYVNKQLRLKKIERILDNDNI